MKMGSSLLKKCVWDGERYHERCWKIKKAFLLSFMTFLPLDLTWCFYLLFNVIIRKLNDCHEFYCSPLYCAKLVLNGNAKGLTFYVKSRKLHNSHLVAYTCICSLFFLEQWKCWQKQTQLFLFHFFTCIPYGALSTKFGFLPSKERNRHYSLLLPHSFLLYHRFQHKQLASAG